MFHLNSLKMNYLVSDLDVEDISYITASYPQGAELDSVAFSEAIDILDNFVDDEEDGETGEMLAGLQILKDPLFHATDGAVKITIFQDRLPV